MLRQKNRVMLWIALGILALMGFIQILDLEGMGMQHQHGAEMTHHTGGNPLLNGLFVGLALLFYLAAWISTRFHNDRAAALLVTLSLTFSSIAIIAGGKGLVEYHFSIFMVLAIILFYESIPLLLASTVVFAAQHLLGFLYFPEIVYGIANYSFSMVAIHLIFVILFISVAFYQITTRKTLISDMENLQDRKIKEAVNQIIDTVTEASGHVLSNARELTSNSDSLGLLAAGVIQSMEQVDRTAHLQEHGVRSSKGAISGMLAEMMMIAETASAASNFSEEVAREADNGNDSIQLTIRQMQSLSQSVNETAAMIKLLNERSQEIDDITVIITDIASRTNLLALNAAIEAARAGEHGKGFTVVSTEVRKLSEQTSQSAQRIAGLVQDIQMSNRMSMASMDQVLNEVQGSEQAVGKAGDAFGRILQSVRSVAGQIQQISAASQEMSASTRQFSEALANISDQSAELASSVVMVNGSAQEQNELIHRSSELAAMLSKQSDSLNGIIVDTKRSFSMG
ncbi:methyl-accepting chemotaxis protein [Paenibacillus glycanilyticus]|uniref:Methyl-accepting transducer domain-containing protein n=1 Tax=Paenibacillus glycanilyticus TaxID=126569 RepID=A0ABQ6GLV5_9BACL|nr:methyl-accepting chemotaxis protein [Paenibacillus glycanilyticus]GLX70012.1 hypothetical protein MU1_43580 [Paenibacillus glycanilyticus]